MHTTINKIVLLGVNLFALALKASETDFPPYDKNSPSHGSSSSSSAGSPNNSDDKGNDQQFDELMRKLRTLNTSNGKIQPCINAILDYKNSFKDPDTAPTLESIRDKILQENLKIPKILLVHRAFNSLLDSTNSSNKALQFTIPLISLLDSTQIPPGARAKKRRACADSTEELKRTAFSFAPDEEHASFQEPEENIEPLVGKLSLSAPQILGHLKQFIAGQDDALESLSYLAHRFLCNKLLVDQGKSRASGPSHCILTGPTGCGKSESLKQLGLFLRVPILHINARSLTDEGFKGQNFSECIASFCDDYFEPKSAIVAIDEIDKLGSTKDSDLKNFGNAIQRVLLSPLDGNPVSAKGRQHSITNWWFIGTGAFSSLKSIHDGVKDRTSTAKSHDDIIQAGFEPEFVGRFASIIPFKGHTSETMFNVIKREGSPLSKIQKEFELFYGVDLNVEDGALRRLAEASIEINLGVRSLYTILNVALQPMYSRAIELMDSMEEKVLNVTLADITPSIDQFIKSNEGKKASKHELPEYLKHMYI